MDEIITRWASDLSKYQKEFQLQAQQVTAWDQTIAENSNKINKLWYKTAQAEKDAGEIERQLWNVENAQAELGSWLDRYEKEIDELMDGQGRGSRDGLQGPDQEREKTWVSIGIQQEMCVLTPDSYKLAEKLSDRLNELNKDLTEMIEEVNGVSQTLSKTTKPDDPVCPPPIPFYRFIIANMNTTALHRRQGPQLPPRPAPAHRHRRHGAAEQNNGRAEGAAADRRCAWSVWAWIGSRGGLLSQL
jgi:nuclear pore complex protein Nup62